MTSRGWHRAEHFWYSTASGQMRLVELTHRRLWAWRSFAITVVASACIEATASGRSEPRLAGYREFPLLAMTLPYQ